MVILDLRYYPFCQRLFCKQFNNSTLKSKRKHPFRFFTDLSPCGSCEFFQTNRFTGWPSQCQSDPSDNWPRSLTDRLSKAKKGSSDYCELKSNIFRFGRCTNDLLNGWMGSHLNYDQNCGGCKTGLLPGRDPFRVHKILMCHEQLRNTWRYKLNDLADVRWHQTVGGLKTFPSPGGDRVYTCKPQHNRLWSINLADVYVLWMGSHLAPRSIELSFSFLVFSEQSSS